VNKAQYTGRKTDYLGNPGIVDFSANVGFPIDNKPHTKARSRTFTSSRCTNWATDDSASANSLTECDGRMIAAVLTWFSQKK
jgi:hypothetical protein